MQMRYVSGVILSRLPAISMKKSIYLILTLISASCGEVKQTNKIIKGIHYISTDQSLHNADTFNEIISTLTKDGFKLRIDSTNNDTLTFKMHDDDLEVIDFNKASSIPN